MILSTERMILRPWALEDDSALFRYASDPEVAYHAGWPPHPDRGYSRVFMERCLMRPETYAVTSREGGEVIGNIVLRIYQAGYRKVPKGEGEFGFWLGRPYWGRGLMTEALSEVVRHAFEELRCVVLWCDYFDGNERSRRVQEKCGFEYVRSVTSPWPQLREDRTRHIGRLTRTDWMAAKKISGNCKSGVAKGETLCYTASSIKNYVTEPRKTPEAD